MQTGNDRNWETEGDLCPGGSRDNVAAALELDQDLRMGSLCKDGEEKKQLFIGYLWIINYTTNELLHRLEAQQLQQRH